MYYKRVRVTPPPLVIQLLNFMFHLELYVHREHTRLFKKLTGMDLVTPPKTDRYFQFTRHKTASVGIENGL